MTEKKASEILRTKYPEATIFKRNSFGGTSSSALAVVFKPQGKVYNYQGLSYQQVLEKLGFNILYKHNVEAMKSRFARLEEQIKIGGEENLFFGEWYTFTSEEISAKKEEIKDLQDEILKAIIC